VCSSDLPHPGDIGNFRHKLTGIFIMTVFAALGPGFFAFSFTGFVTGHALEVGRILETHGACLFVFTFNGRAFRMAVGTGAFRPFFVDRFLFLLAVDMVAGLAGFVQTVDMTLMKGFVETPRYGGRRDFRLFNMTAAAYHGACVFTGS
jgi:hypothetical protein